MLLLPRFRVPLHPLLPLRLLMLVLLRRLRWRRRRPLQLKRVRRGVRSPEQLWLLQLQGQHRRQLLLVLVLRG